MRCAVSTCDNNNKDNVNLIRFYSFPKDKVLRKHWIRFCRRKDQFNPKTSRICCAHFAPDDIERNLQYEMGFSLKNGYKLKPGTIPTIHPRAEPVSVSSRSNRMQARARQDMIKCLLEQAPALDEATAEADQEDEIDIVAKEEDCNSNQFSGEDSNSTETLKERIASLESEVEALKRDNFILMENQQSFQQRIRSLKRLLQKTEYERNNIEEKLKQIFTAGQVKKLKNGDRKIHWSEADIVQAATLYSTSPKAYKLLQKNNFPLPAIRTLQTWSHKGDISSEIIETVVEKIEPQE